MEIGFLDTPGQANNVAVSGNLAYIADGEGGLRVVDVSNPAAPQPRGFFDDCCANAVAVLGNVAYLASYAGVRVIDVSNPANPQLRTSFSLPPVDTQSIAVSGGLIFVAGDVGQLFILR
jgi:hypothetical protein